MPVAEPFVHEPFISGRLYFAVVKRPPSDTSRRHYFQTDTTLQYEPFFKDFGPLNLGLLYRFCKTLNAKLKVFVALGFFMLLISLIYLFWFGQLWAE